MDTYAAARLTETEAREYLEAIRWPNGPVCGHCGSAEGQMRLAGEAHRDGVIKCGACREQYTVTVNTVMHKTHIPLAKWVHAFHILCAAKKSVSAVQLQEMLGLGSYRSAWHMAHRIRAAMKQAPLKKLLANVVELDETFVGGKPRKGSAKPRIIGGKQYGRKRGPAPDFKDRKVPLLVAVERDGQLRSRVTDDVRGETLRSFALDHVSPSAHLMTDERPAYGGIGGMYAAHDVVLHKHYEFARGICHVNTAESHNAIVKRSVMGTFHKVSKKHLQRYADEIAFKWNGRKVGASQRADEAVRLAGAKRLSYKTLVAK